NSAEGILASLHPARKGSLPSQSCYSPSSSCSFRNHFCELCFRGPTSSPLQNLPVSSFRHHSQTGIRIHRNRSAHACQHPLVMHPVSISSAFPQIQLPFLRKPPHCDCFRLSKYGLAENLPCPAAVFFFQPRRANMDLCKDISFRQFRTQPLRNFYRENLQRSRNEHNSFAICSLPRGTFHSFREKKRTARLQNCPETGRAHSAQIRLIPF